MKAQTALITVNEVTKLHVLLMPEDEKEVAFLKKALDKAEGVKGVSQRR
jgi:hypothetical protein